jgi:hypothetical protein
MATVQFGGHCCETPSSSTCNRGNWPENTYSHYGFHFSKLNNAISLAAAQSEIRAKRPVEVYYAWTGGGTHVAIVRGFYDNGNLEVNDPWYGPGRRTYSYVLSAYGLGTLDDNVYKPSEVKPWLTRRLLTLRCLKVSPVKSEIDSLRNRFRRTLRARNCKSAKVFQFGFSDLAPLHVLRRKSEPLLKIQGIRIIKFGTEQLPRNSQGRNRMDLIRTTGKVVEIAKSPIAEKIDEAVEWIDQNAKGDPLVRLLMIPSYFLTAFWL